MYWPLHVAHIWLHQTSFAIWFVLLIYSRHYSAELLSGNHNLVRNSSILKELNLLICIRARLDLSYTMKWTSHSQIVYFKRRFHTIINKVFCVVSRFATYHKLVQRSKIGPTSSTFSSLLAMCYFITPTVFRSYWKGFLSDFKKWSTYFGLDYSFLLVSLCPAHAKDWSTSVNRVLLFHLTYK